MSTVATVDGADARIALSAASVPAQRTDVRAAARPPRDLWVIQRNRALEFHWDRPAGVTRADVDGYRIALKAGRGDWTTVIRNTRSSRTAALVEGLRNGRSYRFRVAAIVDGVVGRWSAASVAVEPAPPLRRGATGERVRFLQAVLARRGYDVDVDGVFGPGTEAAVKSWEGQLLVRADGVVDPVVQASLGMGPNNGPVRRTEAQLADAMEAYLDGRSSGKTLPADTRLALSLFRYRVSGAASTFPWRTTSIDPVGYGRVEFSMVGLDNKGAGPVLILVNCFNTVTVARWCGIERLGSD